METKQKRKYRKWKPGDIAWIKANIETHSIKQMAEKFDVEYNNMYMRLQNLGFITDKSKLIVCRNRWTDAQVQYLKEHYHKTTVDKIAADLGMKKQRVFAKATALGLKKDTLKTVWTAERVERLREKYPSCDLDALCAEFGVNRKALRLQAYKLGIQRQFRSEKRHVHVSEEMPVPVVEVFPGVWRKKWSDDEKAWIKEHVGVKTIRQMGQHFRVSDAAVKGIAERMGISQAELSGAKPMVKPVPVVDGAAPAKTEWKPFSADKRADLLAALASLHSETILFGNKKLYVKAVNYAFGKYRVFTDGQTFVKDDAQFLRFLDEIKIQTIV